MFLFNYFNPSPLSLWIIEQSSYCFTVWGCSVVARENGASISISGQRGMQKRITQSNQLEDPYPWNPHRNVLWFKHTTLIQIYAHTQALVHSQTSTYLNAASHANSHAPMSCNWNEHYTKRLKPTLQKGSLNEWNDRQCNQL